MRHLQVLASLAEHYDETSIERLSRRSELQANTSVQWYRAAGVDIDGIRGHRNAGQVVFSSDSLGGFIADVPTLDPVLEWIEQLLADDRFDRDFAKINSSGCVEQHLVLRVDMGNAIPPECALVLLEESATLPSRPPQVPGRSFTGLWLIPEFGASLLYWTSASGWARFAAR